jgi:MFS family permease
MMPAINFLIPLYIQIVQGNSSLQTSLSIIPYSLSIAVFAALVVRVFPRFTARTLSLGGCLLVAAGLTLLAVSIQNSWGNIFVILGMVIVGMGEGALLTLIFNTLVSSSPSEFAGDVGAWRGTLNNLSSAIGTAIAAALAIGVLSTIVLGEVEASPQIDQALISQVSLDSIDFVSNDRLDELLAETTATPEQQAEAQRINEEARLRALRISFLVLAALALIALIPAAGMPPVHLGQGRSPEPDLPLADEAAGQASRAA